MFDTDSPGMSWKSYADLYDALTLCFADFVDSWNSNLIVVSSYIDPDFCQGVDLSWPFYSLLLFIFSIL